jgi:hypothetical protein
MREDWTQKSTRNYLKHQRLISVYFTSVTLKCLQQFFKKICQEFNLVRFTYNASILSFNVYHVTSPGSRGAHLLTIRTSAYCKA